MMTFLCFLWVPGIHGPWTKTVRNGPALKMLKLRTGLNQDQTNFKNRGLVTRVKTMSKLLDRTRTNLKIWRSMEPCYLQILRSVKLGEIGTGSFFPNLDCWLRPEFQGPTTPSSLRKPIKRLDFIFRIYLISVEHVNIFYLCQVFNLGLQLLVFLLNSKVILISVWASLSNGSQGGSGIISVKLFHMSLAMVILDEFCSTDITFIFSLLTMSVNWTK